MGMEWTAVQHLDLRHVGRGTKPLQPHAAAFHPVQAVIAVAVGTHIIVLLNFLRRFLRVFSCLWSFRRLPLYVREVGRGVLASDDALPGKWWTRQVGVHVPEIGRLQKVQGPAAISAKDEMARLSRHLGSSPLQAKHRINCIRTAIKRNMEVQNYAYAKQQLELLFSKAPPSKQDELRSLIDMCVQRGLTNKSIDPLEDPSHLCAATLSRLSTIGHDFCDLCGAKFSALTSPGCIVCGMGSIKRSDSAAGAGPATSPFG